MKSGDVDRLDRKGEGSARAAARAVSWQSASNDSHPLPLCPSSSKEVPYFTVLSLDWQLPGHYES